MTRTPALDTATAPHSHAHGASHSHARPAQARFSPFRGSALDRILLVAPVIALLWGAVYWALH